MPRHLNQIPKTEWTQWESEYNAKRPYHFYRIGDDWDVLARDFMAYWNGRMQDALEEFGHPSAKPVVDIDRWFAPIVRGDVKPVDAPDERWKEYDKATTGGGGRTSVRTHVDGRTLNERGETVGRWKEPEGTILDKVKSWAQETHHGKAHVRRWKEAANGIQPGTFPEAGTMTAKEASEYEVRFMKSRWGPAARAIRDREIGFTGGTVDAQLEETLKVLNERPDVEVRKYNPETNTLDVLSPADAAYKAEQDAYAAEVEEYQASGSDKSFDDWKHAKDNPDSPFSDNGVYVMDRRTGCFINYDKVYRRRRELTAENVRYRLSRHPDGTVQISWLALEYEGCLCFLPHSQETGTRMVPAEEVRKLIVDGWRVLTHKAYSKNQSGMGARDDKFESFRLWVQYSPQGDPLGICPTQGDSSDGKWRHDDELWADILTSHRPEEVAPVDAPADIANAILAGDWAEVARLAQKRAIGG